MEVTGNHRLRQVSFIWNDDDIAFLELLIFHDDIAQRV